MKYATSLLLVLLSLSATSLAAAPREEQILPRQQEAMKSAGLDLEKRGPYKSNPGPPKRVSPVSNISKREPVAEPEANPYKSNPGPPKRVPPAVDTSGNSKRAAEAEPEPFRAVSPDFRKHHSDPELHKRVAMNLKMERVRRQSSHDAVSVEDAIRRRELEDLKARNAEPDPDPEPATQYAFAASTTTTTSAKAASSSAAISSTSGYWTGASSYYLFALGDSDRAAVLNAIQSGGFKVVRIFIASVYANNKGSGNAAVNDLEPSTVGVYDDTILKQIDQLMYDCYVRGLKLLIAMDDRYALGFWSTNAYATTYGIVKSGSSGAQQVSDASNFYTNSAAIANFDKRLTHILTHENSLMGNLAWKDLDSVIWGLEPQNEPQGHMTMASSSWMCDRAAHIKSLLPSGSKIKTSSGGGITLELSLGSWATSCASVDVISVHDYGTTPSVTVPVLVAAQKQTSKLVMLGEWGITGANKAATIAAFVSALKAASMPQMYWEIVKPGKAASDFEVWTDEPSWASLTGSSYDGDSPTYPTSGYIGKSSSGGASAATTSAHASSSTSSVYTPAYKTSTTAGTSSSVDSAALAASLSSRRASRSSAAAAAASHSATSASY